MVSVAPLGGPLPGRSFRSASVKEKEPESETGLPALGVPGASAIEPETTPAVMTGASLEPTRLMVSVEVTWRLSRPASCK